MLARERRGVQRSVLGEMAALLPVGQELVSHAEPRTVLRLALCYLRYEEGEGERERERGRGRGRGREVQGDYCRLDAFCEKLIFWQPKMYVA